MTSALVAVFQVFFAVPNPAQDSDVAILKEIAARLDNVKTMKAKMIIEGENLGGNQAFRFNLEGTRDMVNCCGSLMIRRPVV